jgi:hypothetical protein
VPVFLARRPAEPVDQDLVAFFERLLNATHRSVFRDGAWQLCERSGWPDNLSFLSIVGWCWVKDGERFLVVMNFGSGRAQARVRVPWDDLRGKTWRLADSLSDATYDRDGDEMRNEGLYVDLEPWQCHVLQVTGQ